MIESYSKTKTKVHIAGVRVGPSKDYSCGPLEFDGVVTSNDVGTDFESNTKLNCTSPNGRALVVSDLSGYDLDSRSRVGGQVIGDWTLKFGLNIQEPEDYDAGVFSKIYIICKFELMQM